MEQKFVDRMVDGCRDLGISLLQEQIDQLYKYYGILIEWNEPDCHNRVGRGGS